MPSNDGELVVTKACSLGHTHLVEFLIRTCNLNPESKGLAGKTPLERAGEIGMQTILSQGCYKHEGIIHYCVDLQQQQEVPVFRLICITLCMHVCDLITRPKFINRMYFIKIFVIFGPTCACARWAHMQHSLSVYLSVTGPKITCPKVTRPKIISRQPVNLGS